MSEIDNLWDKFCDEIINKNRFLVNLPFRREFENILNNCEKTLHKGTTVYRARIFEGKIPMYWKRADFTLKGDFQGYGPLEMKSTPSEKALSARVNPERISYLYTASEMKTAIAEIRPWRGAEVCVADIVLNCDLKFASFSDINGSLTNEEIELIKLVSKQFAIPINPSERIKYLPTQYISEYLKAVGFSGLIYESAMASGFNIAMFYDYTENSMARITKTRVYKIGNVEYNFDLLELE